MTYLCALTAQGHCMSWEASCSYSVCLQVFLLVLYQLMKCLCLIAEDYQTQSLVEQRSSASSLANCTPLVTLSTQRKDIQGETGMQLGQTKQNKQKNKGKITGILTCLLSSVKFL